ncbi:MAG: hypothetical protein Fur0014_05470 [Rubrivivax sp.]
MIYRFRSPATGDVVMLGESGDELLRLLGREPARQGIIEPAAMPAAIEALQRAVEAAGQPGTEGDEEADEPKRAVSLRQRVWPMLQMLQRAHAAEQPITWGV